MFECWTFNSCMLLLTSSKKRPASWKTHKRLYHILRSKWRPSNRSFLGRNVLNYSVFFEWVETTLLYAFNGGCFSQHWIQLSKILSHLEWRSLFQRNTMRKPICDRGRSARLRCSAILVFTRPKQNEERIVAPKHPPEVTIMSVTKFCFMQDKLFTPQQNRLKFFFLECGTRLQIMFDPCNAKKSFDENFSAKFRNRCIDFSPDDLIYYLELWPTTLALLRVPPIYENFMVHSLAPSCVLLK